MTSAVPRVSVALLLLGCLSIGGVCAAGAQCCAAAAAAKASGCHEPQEAFDQVCCCRAQLTADQTALKQTKVPSILPATVLVDAAPDVSSGAQVTLCLDHPTPPPQLDRQALLCVYLN